MATEENNFNDNIDDVGSQDVAIPEIPDPKEGTEVKPGTIAEELTSQSGASIEERTQDKKRDAVLNLSSGFGFSTSVGFSSWITLGSAMFTGSPFNLSKSKETS